MFPDSLTKHYLQTLLKSTFPGTFLQQIRAQEETAEEEETWLVTAHNYKIHIFICAVCLKAHEVSSNCFMLHKQQKFLVLRF